MSILEETVTKEAIISPKELLVELHNVGLRTPAEAAKFVREDRNAR
jgi:hypothetical protein